MQSSSSTKAEPLQMYALQQSLWFLELSMIREKSPKCQLQNIMVLLATKKVYQEWIFDNNMNSYLTFQSRELLLQTIPRSLKFH